MDPPLVPGIAVCDGEAVESRAQSFQTLQQAVVGCRLCPRLVEWRERVAAEKVRRFRDQDYWGRPLPAFGDVDAALVIVGLAPAAHGGNRTGRMFTGDRSGDWLYGALHTYGFANQPTSVHKNDGLELFDCVVTAAVRCAPPDNKPSPQEFETCSRYLDEELRMLQRKRVVVALGRIALVAFLKAWKENGGQIPGSRVNFEHGGEWVLPGGVTLISSFHPSQRNTQTGKLTRAMFHRIFRRARQVLESDKKPRQRVSHPGVTKR